MTENNGKVHGIKLHAFTFEDSGVTITYRKLSPNTILEFNSEFDSANNEPIAPMQKVTYADGRDGMEPNESHPDHIDAKRKYAIKKQTAMQSLFIKRSIVITLNDEQKKEVEDFRQFWRDEYKKELPGTDKEVFIAHIACSTPEDMRDLIGAISRRSIPTEVAISEASKSV